MKPEMKSEPLMTKFESSHYSTVTHSPLPQAGTMEPFPPKGARELAAPQSVPAPIGGRMSVGHRGPRKYEVHAGWTKGGCFKYRLFLLTPIIFLLVIFMGCTKKTTIQTSANPSAGGPDQLFTHARFVVMDKGLTSAIISADSVYVYTSAAISKAIGNLVVHFYNKEGNQYSVLTASKGIVFGKTDAIDSLRAEGDVVIVWKEKNARMETPFLRWIGSTRRIFADSTVVLTLNEALERGVGLEAPDDLKSYTMKKVSGYVQGQGIQYPGKK
jgi:LPS export ABC transporter protein LptC